MGKLGTDKNQDVKFDFFVEELTADEFPFPGTNETFSRSGFTLIMERSPTPFFMNTYIPTALLTLSSFIGFLIPVDMVPGRMAVLVTTFLMLVNISSTERDRGPEVRLKKTEGGSEGEIAAKERCRCEIQTAFNKSFVIRAQTKV